MNQDLLMTISQESEVCDRSSSCGGDRYWWTGLLDLEDLVEVRNRLRKAQFFNYIMGPLTALSHSAAHFICDRYKFKLRSFH